MTATNNPNLVDDKYGIKDLVDLEQLRDIIEKFTLATGFTIGLLDHPDLNVLIASGWRDICTVFHRGCPAAAKICVDSNSHLLNQLTEPNQLVIEPCAHGLVDCATPIIIKGKHIASLATGQLIFEPPDIEQFRKHAKQFGFDEKTYLEALEKVPVVSREQLLNVTAFLGSLAVVITELGYATLKSKEETSTLQAEIAERKRVEKELRNSERKYRILHVNMRDAFVRVSMDGSIQEFNAIFQDMLGYTEEELYSKTYTEITPEKWHNSETRIVNEQVLTRGYSDVYEKEYRRKDGTVFPIEIRTMLTRDAAGEPEAMWAAIRDITERKQAEEKRIAMETQMYQVQKLESLGVLAGGIAHDFNNLLMAILGNIDLALTDVTPEMPIRANLLEAEKAGLRAADLCREMLAYTGKGRFIVKCINFNELVKDMMQILKVSISKKAFLRSNFTENPPVVEADAAQLRQVIMNLIINASDAIGEEDGVISITTGITECNQNNLKSLSPNEQLKGGTYAYLKVSDTGCGMDETTKIRIFEPFFTTKFTGRGLGMSAVQGIVRSHKGTLDIDSEPGKGTTVTLLLPAANQAATPLGDTEEEVVRWRGNGTILLVDDEESVRAVGKHMLENMGFCVKLSEDGADAIALLRKMQQQGDEMFACIILDLTMPHMNGEETFREIRRMEIDVPVLISSGYNKNHVTQPFIRDSLAGFIQKPYRTKALAAKLRKVLGG